MGLGKPQSAFADDHDVVGALQDELGDLRGRLDAAQRADRAGPARGSVHDASVEFDYAFFIGQAAVADTGVLGVFLDDVDPGHHCIEGVASGSDDFNDLFATGQAVGACDHDVLLGRGGSGRDRACRSSQACSE